MTTELDCSIGASVEVTYGTIVTPTKFVEFTDETLDWSPTFSQGTGLRVGSRVARAARRAQLPVQQQVTGDFTCEAASKGLGWIFNAAFGTVTTTQRGATGVYQQNHTLVTSDFLPSWTIQKGTPPLGGGATVAHTFAGMVCSQLEIDAPNSGIVTVKSTWNGQKVDTATGYAAPSYPTPVELFEFQEGAITIGGTPTAPTTTALATSGTAVAEIRDFTFLLDNGLDTGGFTLGGGGKRARKPAVGVAPITGTMTAEFDATTYRDAYLNQTDLAVVLTFTGASTIGSSDHPALQIYIPNIRLESELPKANGGDVITQSLSYTVLDNLSAAPVTLCYVSTDTAP